MYGFFTSEGFVGRMSDGRMRLFATMNDYRDAVEAEEDHSDEKERPPNKTPAPPGFRRIQN